MARDQATRLETQRVRQRAYRARLKAERRPSNEDLARALLDVTLTQHLKLGRYEDLFRIMDLACRVAHAATRGWGRLISCSGSGCRRSSGFIDVRNITAFSFFGPVLPITPENAVCVESDSEADRDGIAGSRVGTGRLEVSRHAGWQEMVGAGQL